jgi:hypothetical protein
MRRGVSQVGAVIWLAVLVGGVFFQSYIIWTRYSTSQPPRLSDWLALIPILLLIYKHLVGHYQTLGIVAEKAQLWLRNSTTEWSLEVRLSLKESDECPETIAKELESVIRDRYQDGLSINRKTPTEFTFRLARQFTANASVEEGEQPSIYITILDMHVSYRDSVRRIEDHLCPLFEHIENHFHASPDGRKYSLIAFFPEGNPYFGVFIQKLKIENVAALNLTIKNDRPDSVLSIKQDRIELVAKSLNTFRTEFVSTFRLELGAS